MSRRMNNRGHNNQQKPRGFYVDEHDDRGRKEQTQRRVSFKPSSGKNRDGPIKSRLELAIRARLEDDEEMAEMVAARYHKDRTMDHGRRKGSPIPRGKLNIRKLMSGLLGWYQITIPFGEKYDKNLVLNSIMTAIAPNTFEPRYWKQNKGAMIFYTDDLTMAERLLNLDRSVQMPDGFKLAIKVRPGVPITYVDDNLKERMKLAMAKRYNSATKALDLSKFHDDVDLKDVFCGLFRAPLMNAVIDIIADNIPQLEALNLSGNQINMLDHFKCLQDKLPHIKILYLSENKIQNVAHLSAFRGLPIVELELKNNPMRHRFRTETQYVNEIRRRFPKLVKLDGQELPPAIVFDLQEASSLPPAKASYLCDASGADIVRKFLEQYFMIFDSDNRQPLLDAYHEQAMMSISLPSASQSGKLSNYWLHNRNILRSPESDSKYRLLRYGRLPCVSLLSELPKTQHDLQSISCDLALYTPKLISLTVAGIFRERNATAEGATPQIRSFQRQFIIVPAGGGLCIRNELIFITNPTSAQVRTAFKAAPATPVVSPQPSTPAIPSHTASGAPISAPGTSTAPPTPDHATKIRMVQAMSAQTNMNLHYSEKCLEEMNWNFNNAIQIFNNLQKENRIPAEAFVK